MALNKFKNKIAIHLPHFYSFLPHPVNDFIVWQLPWGWSIIYVLDNNPTLNPEEMAFLAGNEN